jgi:hypothetical protein
MSKNTRNTPKHALKKSKAQNKEATHNKKVIKLCLNKELINCHQQTKKKKQAQSLNNLLAKHPFHVGKQLGTLVGPHQDSHTRPRLLLTRANAH